ncbi:hypothetical protein KP509_12G008600 [Ceratopteris richardii]|uniref:Uncharacterized protein n=1 Tax=Ceratopteris richardii TaxID=49495 RepID=A0A8T2TII6_CERRI|nr:hypothetical protein KP509_12G008600 [Ceratopteris richardii]
MGRRVWFTDAYTYLGVVFSGPIFSMRRAAESRWTRAYAALGRLEMICSQVQFQEPCTKLWLFDTLVTSAMLCGVHIWGPSVRMAFYKDHLLRLTADGIVVRPSYMDTHLSYGVRCAIGRMRTSSHQLEIETGRYRRVPTQDRICRICHMEPERELHYICHCSAYYEIRGCFHCLFREGFGPFSRAMGYEDQRCLGLFLLELRRHRDSLLRHRDSLSRLSKRKTVQQVTDYFREVTTTTQRDRSAVQQSPDLTSLRGTLVDRARGLERSKRPRLQRRMSQQRRRLQMRIRLILARHARYPVRVLTMEDIEEIRHRPMRDFL